MYSGHSASDADDGGGPASSLPLPSDFPPPLLFRAERNAAIVDLNSARSCARVYRWRSFRNRNI